MRSFIKSHRKNDSVGFELMDSSNEPWDKHTPVNSPVLMLSSQLTPPQAVHSPKKLLTPIRNLFKTTPTESPTSAKKHKRHSQSISNLSEILGDTKSSRRHSNQSINGALLNNFTNQQHQQHFNQLPSLAPPAFISSNSNSSEASVNSKDNKQNDTKQVSFGASLVKDEAFLEPAEEDEYYEDSDSDSSQFSFVKDRKGGRNTSVKYYKSATSLAKKKEEPPAFSENDLGYEEDEFSDYDYENNGMDDENEDYDYDEEQGASNYNDLLGVDDEQGASNYNDLLGVDDEQGASGYNDLLGIDDDTALYHTAMDSSDMPEASVQDRPDSVVSLQTENILPPVYGRYKVFNKSYHLSMSEECWMKTLDGSSSSSDHEVNTDDILENYMDFSSQGQESTPSFEAQTPELSASDNLHLYDVSSPIITGLTIGHNLRHRIPSRGAKRKVAENREFIHRPTDDKVTVGNAPDSPMFRSRVLKSFRSSLCDDLNVKIHQKVRAFEEATKPTAPSVGLGIGTETLKDDAKPARLSIAEITDLLAGIEMNQEPETENKRLSVADMMKMLAKIESDTPQTEENQPKRNSIANMMATLAQLDTENEKKTPKGPINALKKQSKNEKRYSWYGNDETINLKTAELPRDSSSEKVNNDDYNINYHDLLDEVNQLPEDFDFDEHVHSPPPENDFTRSKSYRNRPIKSVMETNAHSNKIETSNKTVTFYRSNSSGRASDVSKSRSLSRAPSGRSIMSFTSVNEEDSDDEDTYEPKEIYQLLLKVTSGINDVNKSPSALGTIVEADNSFKNGS